LSLRVLSLGQIGKTGNFKIAVNTTIEMCNALEAARGMEFPSSDAKWPSTKNAFASDS